MKSINFKYAFLFLAIFISCNNPLHRTYSPATYTDDIEAIRSSDKIEEQDIQNLISFIMLAHLSGKDISGKSYNEMLDKIKSFQQKNHSLESSESVEKEMKRRRLSSYIDVKLQSKIFTKDNNKNVLIFTVTLTNVGKQKIKTVTGKLIINDLLEKPVKNINIFFDDDIAPGETISKNITVAYNDTDENDRRLRSKDIFDIRTEWNPEKIILENGKLLE